MGVRELLLEQAVLLLLPSVLLLSGAHIVPEQLMGPSRAVCASASCTHQHQLL